MNGNVWKEVLKQYEMLGVENIIPVSHIRIRPDIGILLDDNGNYILTNDKEIFSYIDYRYLDINTIKEYIKMGTLNNNIYTIKVSDILLNNNSNDVITITVDDINKELIIDYTNLFKVNNNSLYKELVRIKYSNINSISSLDN